jgi:arylsulfatase A-like enzyme
MFILKSDLANDQYGLPGLGAMTPGDVPLGGGMHGGINPHELNTVLIVGAETAEGRGSLSSAPAGIIDIGPTVLGLLGIALGQTMQGRNLARPAHEEARVARHSAGRGSFSQHVDIVEQDGRRFILGGGQ